MNLPQGEWMHDRQKLLEIFQGNTDAFELASMLAELVDTWDDAIDRDKPVTDDRLNRSFWLALVEMPGNEFYRSYGHMLRPVVATGILNWIAANKLQSSRDVHHVEIAHVIRYSIGDVLMLIATIIGGQEWGFKVAADIRLMCQKNTLAEFKEEHGHDA
jgi:hypothetical protein